MLLRSAALASLPALALAQTAPQTPPPPPDAASIVTLQGENDAASTLRGTSDQYYTSGLRLGYTSGEDAVGPASLLGQFLYGPGPTRLSLDIQQLLFTPRNTQLDPPNPLDRPYAGELYATLGIIHDTPLTRDFLGLSLGVVGPSAQGKPTQNGFHSLIGDNPNRGWNYQIKDQPAVELYAQHTWRLPLADLWAVDLDALPSVGAGGGDVRDYVQAGSLFRIGQGLDSDFGPSRILPGLSGLDAYRQTAPFVWYVFGGADGQAVGYDVSLDGSTFRSNTPSVHRVWDVGELEAGLTLIWHGVRVSYTQTWQTQEFRGAKAGLFNFGSLVASVRF